MKTLIDEEGNIPDNYNYYYFFIPNTCLYLEMNLRKIIFPHIFLITTGYQNDKIK